MKRFIAGAVCPQCQALDRLILQITEIKDESGNIQQEKRRTCVSCGFSDLADKQGQSSMPKSRIERGPRVRAAIGLNETGIVDDSGVDNRPQAAGSVQVVNIISPPKSIKPEPS